jgi:hypothetical protein
MPGKPYRAWTARDNNVIRIKSKYIDVIIILPTVFGNCSPLFLGVHLLISTVYLVCYLPLQN